MFVLFQSRLGNWLEFATKVQIVSSWPANWIWWGEPYFNISVVVLVGMVSSLICAVNPFFFIFRLTSLLSAFAFLSYVIAVRGYNHHSYYGYALLALVFLFLPIKRFFKSERAYRHQVLLCLWFAAAALGTIYFLIGIGNLYAGIRQSMESDMSIFYPQSLAYFVLYELQTYSKHSILENYVIPYSSLFWLGIFVVILKKLAFPYFLFSRKYLPIYGMALVLFHAFNGLAFGLPFVHLAFQVFLFLVLNPIHKTRPSILKPFKF